MTLHSSIFGLQLEKLAYGGDACEPSTLARDTMRFINGGYTRKDVTRSICSGILITSKV